MVATNDAEFAAKCDVVLYLVDGQLRDNGNDYQINRN